MNIAEIVKRLKYNGDGQERIQEVYNELVGGSEIMRYQAEPYRIMFHWAGSWYCTDTEVGYRVYCFDDVPVCFSIQHGRKCSEDFYWFSNAPIKAMRDYLRSLEEEKYPDDLDFINPEEIDFGEGYTIDFNSNTFSHHASEASFEYVPVPILEYVKDKDKSYISDKVRIKHDGFEKVVDISELTFSWYLTDNGNLRD